MPGNILSIIMQALKNPPQQNLNGQKLYPILPPAIAPANNPRLPEFTPKQQIDPNAFGNRPDGTVKGMGWLGAIPYSGSQSEPDSVMTELSSTFDIDGKNTLIPLLVPSLDNREVAHLANGGAPTDGILNKALTFALSRLKNGLSPFIQPGEKS